MVVTGFTFGLITFTLYDLFRNNPLTNEALLMYALELFYISQTLITIYVSNMLLNEV